ECGQCASTSSNLQTYSIIHVADEQRKQELAKLCADQKQIHQCAAFLVFCADLHRDQMANVMHGGERFDGDYAEALLIATVDVALVMQNVTVAAESIGLGICMIGAMRNEPKAVGALLGLPPFVYAVAGLCIGYPAIDPACKPRLPLKAVLHTEHYLDDETHQDYMTEYDETMTVFYQSQNMHDRDPRWTRVMAGRTGRFHERVELDGFLKDQGFGMQVSDENK
ncbi:MAG: NADPH-dependent oxidoreductase, partial [Candidatus Latescibacteria bacterium]|nr:NADPH-dependent oxidoreductase [Candidatus Latescibacterota bacterium]